MNDSKPISDDYLAAFFGKQRTYYLEVANRLREGEKIVFNLSAFLFGLFWMLYRRMYLYSFLLIIVLVIEVLIENYVFTNWFPEVKDQTRSIFSNLLPGIMMGCFANRLYLFHVRRQIRKVLVEETNEEAIYEKLEKKGGVTLLPFIFILSFILIMVIIGRFFPEALNLPVTH